MDTSFQIIFCDEAHTIYVSDSSGGGQDRLNNSAFTINASAQSISVVSTFCVESVDVPSGLTYSIANLVITINVPKNPNESDRQFTATVHFCDGKTAIIEITQTRIYYRWVEVSGEYICDECESGSPIPPTPPTPTPIVQPTKFYAEYSDSTTYSAACDSDLVLKSTTTKAHSTSYSSMTKATIGDCVLSIGNNAFDNCSSLSSVTIPYGVEEIGSSAFSGCTNLKTINIPDSVTSIKFGVFNGCTSLSSVTLSNSITATPLHLFWNCSSLSSITLPQNLETIGDSSFLGCSSLSEIEVPSSVKAIQMSAFENCSSLRTMYLLSETPPSLGGGALQNTNLQRIYVPCGSKQAYVSSSGWSGYSSIIQESYPCSSFKFEGHYTTHYSKIVSCVSNRVLDNSQIIDDGTYTPSSALTYGTVGNCTDEIASGCFSSAFSSLSSLTIDESVAKIGDEAFYNVPSLREITFLGMIPPIRGNNILNASNVNLKIYVKQDALVVYKTMWSDYASIIYPIT